MDTVCPHSWLPARCEKARARQGLKRGVNFDRLTLVTLVIALAGFASTAFPGL